MFLFITVSFLIKKFLALKASFLTFRRKMDVNLSNAEFHQKVAVPFLDALRNEMESAFDMENIKPVEALLVLDPSQIPEANNASFTNYGCQEINILFSFYGKEKTDVYEGHSVTSPPLITCTAESLNLEYGGYKNYVATMKKKAIEALETEEQNLQSQLRLAEANKTTKQKKLKSIKNDIENIKIKKMHPLEVGALLKDNVVSSAFPNIRQLLKFYILVPMSEAVVERGFSKMKLILTEKRTRLDNESLDALMRISFNNVALDQEAVQKIVTLWKRERPRRIFSDDI